MFSTSEPGVTVGALSLNKTTEPEVLRRSSFWIVLITYPVVLTGLGAIATYIETRWQTTFDPALGYKGTLWLGLFVWIAISIFASCGHVVTVIACRSQVNTFTSSQLVRVIMLAPLLTIGAIFILGYVVGKWTPLVIPTVSALFIFLLVKIHRNRVRLSFG